MAPVSGAGEQHADDVFGDLNRLQAMVGDLDERTLVLSLAAFAEQTLGELIGAFLLPGETSDQLLEGFNAPLGTFSARIKMARSLGLVTRHQAEDLDRLRKMRNEFAHTWEPVSFSSQKIAAHVNGLNFHSLDDKFPETSIEKVRTTIGLLLTELRSSAHQIQKHHRGATTLGHSLLAGIPGSLDEQMDMCRIRLTEIDEELKVASGDRRRWLLAARHRWRGKLEIVKLNAPRERQQEVANLQGDLKAWNREPDY